MRALRIGNSSSDIVCDAIFRGTSARTGGPKRSFIRAPANGFDAPHRSLQHASKPSIVSPPFSPDAEIHRLIPLQNATSHAFNKLSEQYWNIGTPGLQTNTADRPSRQPKESYLDSLRHPPAVHRYKFRKNEKTPPGDQGSALPGRSLANRSAVTETLWRDSGIRETDFWVYCTQWMRISRASIADPIRDEAFKPILTGLSCL